MAPEKPSLLDSLVDFAASAMDALGLNGGRLRWKWRQKRFQLGERGLRTEMAWRSTKTRHKMCPECRALIERKARVCSECGASLRGVAAPGMGRALANLFPGMGAVTGLILLVNGGYFLLLMIAHAKAGVHFSLFGSFDWELMVRFGGGLSRPVPLPDGTVTGGEWWRLVTPIFMHAGLLHFFFNSFLLVQLGPLAQERYGPRFWPAYLACGLAGSIASQWTRPVMTIGASGAIMGLIGLLLVNGLRNRDRLGEAMKGLLFRLLLYTVVLSFAFNIDHRNHFGGFLCGALLGLVLDQGEPRAATERTAWTVVSTAGVLLVLAAFAMVAGSGR